MLHWELLKSNIVYHGCNTYHVRGKACFSMVFHGFPHDGIAVPLGPLWFLPHPLRVLLPRKMFLVQRSKHCRPHCRELWIVVACKTSNMNQQRKRMVLVVIHGNVVLGHAPTCSTLRCVKLFARGLCKPAPITPMIMQVFWYLQGSLQDSLFAIVLQTIFRQMFKLVDFQLDQYVLWSSFSFSSVTIWSLCALALQTSFNQHGSSVVLTKDKGRARSHRTQSSSIWTGYTTVVKPTTYRATHVFRGFHLFSWVFRMMALQFLLVRFGSSHPEDVPGATELTYPHCRRFGLQHFGREWMANAWCLR